MSDSGVAQQISVFRSQINNKRFNHDSLRILESILFSKDVKLLFQLRSSLKEFIRSESLSVIRQIAVKTVDQHLSVLEFFFQAFAIIGDIESCLALRYEALVLREHKSRIRQWLQVSHLEWLNFAEKSLENGFYAISAKACDYALSYLRRNDVTELKTDESFEILQVTEEINKLKNSAITLAASHSIQAQTAEYLRKQLRRANHSLQFAGKDLMLPALCTEMALKSTMSEN